ncbi:MAG: hypothetical protein KGL95_01230, partial [Patescibacteria group bacterium]|nr:hypothetical protein [Patescibacteria group bacterium]
MENEVKNDYIEKAMNELIPIFGVKEFIDHQKLISLVYSKKIKEVIKTIALYLGLPVEVNLSYVPKGYRPNNNDGFQSTHVVKTDRHNHGTGGITAQIHIPPNLPFYGTPGMINFPINVRLSEDCAENPSTLISIMAHELSHILLYSILHKEKENEFYTDLTAMMLGFAHIIKTGRKVIKTQTFNATVTNTEITTYGYLSDENFIFAFNKIENLLSKQESEKKKFLKKLNELRKQLNKTKKQLFYFEKYLEYLDKNLNQKIPQEDGYKISVFHQHGYTDNFQSVVRKNETNLEFFLKFAENLKNYNKQNTETMQKYETQLKLANEEL